MPETPAPNTPAPAVPAGPTMADFEKLQADLKASNEDKAKLAGHVEALRAEAFTAAQEAAFDKTFAVALTEGRAVPADRAVKLALFNSLPPDAGNVITLSAADGKPREIGPRALFLEDIRTAPVKVTLSRVTDASGLNRPAAGEDRNKAVVKEAEKLMANDKNMTHATALVLADKTVSAA